MEKIIAKFEWTSYGSHHFGTAGFHMNSKRNLQLSKLPNFIRRRVLSGVEVIRGRIDARRLKQKISQLHNYEKLADKIRSQLRPYYEEYISTMSTEAMAIGFESAVFLMMLCYVFTPKRILDLGSGFSSLVFRLYMMDGKPTPSIWSVDDEQEWLETTRRFLTSNNLPSDNLVFWQTFREKQHDPFDLVLHDLGGMKTRMETLKEALAFAPQGGLVVLDDVHKHTYRSYAKRVLKELALTSYSLRAFTKDRLGRYSLLVTV
jgi:predicted O-methyltransferase YrrM